MLWLKLNGSQCSESLNNPENFNSINDSFTFSALPSTSFPFLAVICYRLEDSLSLPFYTMRRIFPSLSGKRDKEDCDMLGTIESEWRLFVFVVLSQDRVEETVFMVGLFEWSSYFPSYFFSSLLFLRLHFSLFSTPLSRKKEDVLEIELLLDSTRDSVQSLLHSSFSPLPNHESGWAWARFLPSLYFSLFFSLPFLSLTGLIVMRLGAIPFSFPSYLHFSHSWNSYWKEMRQWGREKVKWGEREREEEMRRRDRNEDQLNITSGTDLC